MPTIDERPVKQPRPDHPITIAPSSRRITVTLAGHVVASSEKTLTLTEAGYAPIHYFPPDDVDFAFLESTDHTSWCPYKGEANYYSVPVGGERSVNAVWQYREAFSAVGPIAGYLAFYASRVDALD